MKEEHCEDCPCDAEEGMCEARGAIWKKGDWQPTPACVPIEEIGF